MRNKGINVIIQSYNKMNGIVKRHLEKHTTTHTKLQIHNITSKTSICYGSDRCIMRKRGNQKLEAAKMRFLRRLLGFT
jgi:hypothetical protein